MMPRGDRGRLIRLALGALAALAPVAVSAQPADLPLAPATTSQYPPGVKVASTPAGPVYADAQGRTLYGMDMRTLIRFGPDPSKYCQAACAADWEPLLAPAGAAPNIAFPRGGRPPQGAGARAPAAASASSPAASAPGSAESFVQPQNAPDWTVIAGAQGPQWVYKGWHMVFVHKGDTPGATAFDGADAFVWNTLKFVPPAPKVETPGNVAIAFVDGAYALADTKGRILFTGDCGAGCADWTPFPAGMASRGLGAWAVVRDADVPHWLYRGKPVYVSTQDDKTTVPSGGTVLRP